MAKSSLFFLRKVLDITLFITTNQQLMFTTKTNVLQFGYFEFMVAKYSYIFILRPMPCPQYQEFQRFWLTKYMRGVKWEMTYDVCFKTLGAKNCVHDTAKATIMTRYFSPPTLQNITTVTHHHPLTPVQSFAAT